MNQVSFPYALVVIGIIYGSIALAIIALLVVSGWKIFEKAGRVGKSWSRSITYTSASKSWENPGGGQS